MKTLVDTEVIKQAIAAFGATQEVYGNYIGPKTQAIIEEVITDLRAALEAKEQPTDEKMREDAEHVKNWVCHNGGLLNEWAKEWNPAKHPPLTAYILKRLDATIDAARAAEGEK